MINKADISKNLIEDWARTSFKNFYKYYQNTDHSNVVMFATGYMNCLYDVINKFNLDKNRCIPNNAREIQKMNIGLPEC